MPEHNRNDRNNRNNRNKNQQQQEQARITRRTSNQHQATATSDNNKQQQQQATITRRTTTRKLLVSRASCSSPCVLEQTHIGRQVLVYWSATGIVQKIPSLFQINLIAWSYRDFTVHGQAQFNLAVAWSISDCIVFPFSTKTATANPTLNSGIHRWLI